MTVATCNLFTWLGSRYRRTRLCALPFCLILAALTPNLVLGATPVANDDPGMTTQALQQWRVARQDPAIPADVKPLLSALKHQLRDLIGHTLEMHATETISLPALRATLLQVLATQQLAYDTPEVVTVSGDDASAAEANAPDFTYGRLQQIALDKPAGHTDLLAVTVRFAVVCGNDTSLYVFRKQNDHWRLIIAQEADAYDNISGALGELQYAISAPTPDGGFYVVTKNVTPWCTSNWQMIRYQVMREGPSPAHPKIILQREEPIYLGNGDSGWLSLADTGFRIEFDGRQELGAIVRRHVAHYEITGDVAHRIPPFAHTPEDFLDEWFELPWEEASRWSEPAARRKLQQIHRRIRAARNNSRRSMLTEFVFDPTACRIGKDRWQIGVEGVTSRESQHPEQVSFRQFFTVMRRGDRFIVQNAVPTSLTRCRALQGGG